MDRLPAPLILLYLFFKVTGIPPTEAQALASRGEDYRQYQRTTSVFIPGFQKKKRIPMNLLDLAERALIPDWLIRIGIRRLLAARLRMEELRNAGEPRAYYKQFLDELRTAPSPAQPIRPTNNIMKRPRHFRANARSALEIQQRLLANAGKTWPKPKRPCSIFFAAARKIEDGMDVLELGCGWGSLCLWIAADTRNAES